MISTFPFITLHWTLERERRRKKKEESLRMRDSVGTICLATAAHSSLSSLLLTFGYMNEWKVERKRKRDDQSLGKIDEMEIRLTQSRVQQLN
jgi:hypothetical protein